MIKMDNVNTVMVARQDTLGARTWALRPEDRVNTVSTHIMEASNVLLAIHDEEIRESHEFKTEEVPSLLESAFMSY